MTKFLCGNLIISCPEKKIKVEPLKFIHLLQMTTLSICGKYLAVLKDLGFGFIGKSTFRFQVFWENVG